MDTHTLGQALLQFSSDSPLLARLILASVEVALLAAAVYLLTRTPRLASPRFRAALWLLVLAKGIFSVAAGSPLPLYLLQAPAAREAQVAPAATLDAGQAARNRLEEERALAALAEAERMDAAAAGAARGDAAGDDAPRRGTLRPGAAGAAPRRGIVARGASVLAAGVASASRASWRAMSSPAGARAVAGLWIAGVCCMILLTLRDFVRIARLRRSATEPSPEILRHYLEQAGLFGEGHLEAQESGADFPACVLPADKPKGQESGQESGAGFPACVLPSDNPKGLESRKAGWKACPTALLASSWSNFRGWLSPHRPPRLLVSDAVSSPALVGVFRPVVLLPTWLVEPIPADTSAPDSAPTPALDPRGIAWLLRHELMHWRLRDTLGLAVRRAAEILLYFHPAVWWAGRRWEEAMELACDRALLRTDADARDYAEQLYGVLQQHAAASRPAAVRAGLCATRTQIGKRIAALLTNPLATPARLSPSSATLLVLLAVAAFSFGLGIARPAPAQQPLGIGVAPPTAAPSSSAGPAAPPVAATPAAPATLLDSPKNDGDAKLTTRIFAIKEKDGPEIKAIVDAAVRSQKTAPDSDSESGVWLNGKNLVVRDTPENLTKIIELLTARLLVATAAPGSPEAASAQPTNSLSRTVLVAHAPAEGVAKGVEAQLADLKSPVKILVDMKTNSLVLQGPPDDVRQAETLVGKLDTSPSVIEVKTEYLDTVTNAKGEQQTDFTNGPNIQALNGSTASFELGSVEPADAATGGGKAKKGLHLPDVLLEVTPLDLGGQLSLTGVATIASASDPKKVTAEDGSGTFVVVRPSQVHFAVKITDPEAGALIGPFETAPGHSLKIRLRAAIVEPAAGGPAPAVGTDEPPKPAPAVRKQPLLTIQERLPKVQADLRSLTVAMESYRVDYDNYPVTLPSLTTPVGYLGGSIPVDPFSQANPPEPYRLEVEPASGHHLVLYSVGPDGAGLKPLPPYDPNAAGGFRRGDTWADFGPYLGGVDPALKAKIQQQQSEVDGAKQFVELWYAKTRQGLPDSLETAVKDRDASQTVPDDLFVPGRKLSYRLAEDRQTAWIYSLGPDGKDDGGNKKIGGIVKKGEIPSGDIFAEVTLAGLQDRFLDIPEPLDRRLLEHVPTMYENQRSLVAKLLDMQESEKRPNALLYYVAAGFLSPKLPDNTQNDLIKTVLASGWNESAAPLMPFLELWQPAFGLIRKGAALDYAKGVGFFDGPATPVPDFLQAQIAAKALCVDGRYFENQGKRREALENYLTVLAMGRDYESPDNTLISSMIGVAASRIATDRVYALVAGGSLASVDLERCRTRLETVDKALPSFADSIRSEAQGPAWWTNRLRKGENVEALIAETKLDSDSAAILRQGAKDLDRVEAEQKKVWDSAVHYVETPWWQRSHEEYDQELERMRKTFLPMVAHAIPNFTEADTRSQTAKACLRVARVATGLEIYKQANGKYPVSLDTLTPAQVGAEPPVDPFTGKALGYRLNGDLYRLWSIGPGSGNNMDANVIGIGTPAEFVYDPTNGTVSAGDVVLQR